MERQLGWLVAGLIGQALLPWVLARATKDSNRRDLLDCDHPAALSKAGPVG